MIIIFCSGGLIALGWWLGRRQEMRLSKFLTFLWGTFCLGFAFFVGDISATIIESTNKIGSAFPASRRP